MSWIGWYMVFGVSTMKAGIGWIWCIYAGNEAVN
jgi:hypothetical protein